MHRCGGDRFRFLPNLVALLSLFAAAGCVTSARVPEATFATAPVGIDDAVGVDGGKTDRTAPAPAAIAEPAEPAVAVNDQPSFAPLIAVGDEPSLLQTRNIGGVSFVAGAGASPTARNVRLAGARPSAGAVRLHVATLQFGRGSASLAREEYIILQAVAALRARNGGRIEVVGHADRGGAHGLAARRVNRMIAGRRADAVADALVALGLPRAAVTAESRGDSEPRYAETTAAGAAGNRRAEVYLLAPETPLAADAAVPEEEVDAGTLGVALQPDPTPSPPEPERADVIAATLTDTATPEPAQAGETVAADSGRPHRVPIATLYFPHASSRMGEREQAIIEAAAVFQREHGGALVVIGHASAAGVSGQDPQRLARANRALSLARADAVALRLAAYGAAAQSVSVIGKGADEPAYAENDAAGEAGNRRVEIYVDLPAGVRLADRGQGLPR